MGTTYSDKLPHDFHLLPGEELIEKKTTFFPPRLFDTTPSSLEQLLRLTGSPSARFIGKNGPSIASLAMANLKKKKSLPLRFGMSKHRQNNEDAPDHLHLYEVVFGRDSLRVAVELLDIYPELARSTTLRLAQLQGVGYNTEREEEPGRIVHEARDFDDVRGQQISQQLGWGWPYYGSVDATPEFIRTLTAYCRLSEENYKFLSTTYTDRKGVKRDIAYALDMAVSWIEQRLQQNREGLLEYKTILPLGIENQVWKDSPDSYHHSDGTIANHRQGIASIEVQVTTYDALIDAAQLYEDSYGDTTRAAALLKKADMLRDTILDVFWTEDKGGYFVLGTDRDDDGVLRQLRIRTSNMGHVLHSRLLEGDDPEVIRKRQATVDQLLSPTLLNISGIRTLANDEVRFRAGAYHNGSVWLWDTHHIARGLRRHGYVQAANELDRRMLHVVETTKIFPEYVRGGDFYLPEINNWMITVWDKTMRRELCVEQPPQEVQAWTVAAIFAIKKRLDRDSRRSINPLTKLKLPDEFSSSELFRKFLQ